MTLEAFQYALRARAERLAGTPDELIRRTAMYHSLYRQSGGTHVFPLIAAHGAQWGDRYFANGLAVAGMAARGLGPEGANKLASLERFAGCVKEINKQVAIETYVSFHMTAAFGNDPEIDQFVHPSLVDVLNASHHAHRRQSDLCAAEKRALFTALFEWEQRHIVTPQLNAAARDLHWPLMETLALRPIIRLGYFRIGERLWFHNFTDADERISHGQAAYSIAETVGWDRVENALAQPSKPKACLRPWRRFLSTSRP